MTIAGARSYFAESSALISHVSQDAAYLEVVATIAERISVHLACGSKLLIAGNGGSAADAQHMAAEIVGRFRHDRKPLAAIALTTNSSVLTAVGNDYGFEYVFSRQVIALAKPGDIFLAISTSGYSSNILAALRAAKDMRIVTIGLTGSNTEMMGRYCDYILSVPSIDTALIQQAHLVSYHAICAIIEQDLVTP